MQSAEKRFDVDLGGLIELFGGHLYSSPDVFARELVQNGADAIRERRRVDADFEGVIIVRIDASSGLVEFIDDGVGLDEAGLENYLSCIARSSKRGAAREEQTIGQFGIGLLSAFLVAESLEVLTRREGSPGLRWVAGRDGAYRVEAAEGVALGTCVRVPLSPEYVRYSDPQILRELLETHVGYLPIPVVLEVEGTREVLTRSAPWLQSDPASWSCWLEERGVRPMDVFELRLRDARGFVWIHDRQMQMGGARCDVYVKGMRVRAAARDVLPDWAGFASAVIEAPALTPTASREDLVRDAALAQLETGIKEQLLAWLASLPDRDSGLFERFLDRHSVSVKGACLESEPLMAAIGRRLPFETSLGTCELGDLLRLAPEPALRFVESPQEFSSIAPIAAAQGVGVINACYVYDLPFLQAYAAQFDVPLHRMDARSAAVLVRPAGADGRRYAAVLRAGQLLLDDVDTELALGRFEPAELPTYLARDEADLRGRAQAMIDEEAGSLARQLLGGLPVLADDRRPRLILNLENPLIQALPTLCSSEVVGRVVRLLYAQAALLLKRSLTLNENRLFTRDLVGLLGIFAGEASRDRMN